MDRSQRRTRWRRLTAGVPRALRALLSARSGAVGIIVILAIPALAGFAGLAIDVGYWYMQRRTLQNAADAAAVSGALEVSLRIAESKDVRTPKVKKAATDDAERNGADRDAVDVNVPPLTGPNTGETGTKSGSVEVIITQPQPLYFASLLRVPPVTIVVRAVAGLVPADPRPACIVALEDKDKDALQVLSNSKIDAQGCAVQVNSDNVDVALRVDSTNRIDNGVGVAAIRSAGTCVTGTIFDDGGGVSPDPLSGANRCPSIGDPLEDREPPFVGSCDYQDIKISDATITGSFPGGTEPTTANTATTHPDTTNCSTAIKKVTLSPGVYCGGLVLDSCANVVFTEGEYIIKDGQLGILSNSAALGDGVGFYLTGTTPSSSIASLNLNSNSSLDIVAPPIKNPKYALEGLVFFEDPNGPKATLHQINSNGTIDFEGALYFSKGKIKIDSNSLASTNSPYTKIIGRTIEVLSNSKLTLKTRFCTEVAPPCTNLPVLPGFSVKVGLKVLLSE